MKQDAGGALIWEKPSPAELDGDHTEEYREVERFTEDA